MGKIIKFPGTFRPELKVVEDIHLEDLVLDKQVIKYDLNEILRKAEAERLRILESSFFDDKLKRRHDLKLRRILLDLARNLEKENFDTFEEKISLLPEETQEAYRLFRDKISCSQRKFYFDNLFVALGENTPKSNGLNELILSSSRYLDIAKMFMIEGNKEMFAFCLARAADIRDGFDLPYSKEYKLLSENSDVMFELSSLERCYDFYNSRYLGISEVNIDVIIDDIITPIFGLDAKKLKLLSEFKQLDEYFNLEKLRGFCIDDSDIVQIIREVVSPYKFEGYFFMKKMLSSGIIGEKKSIPKLLEMLVFDPFRDYKKMMEVLDMGRVKNLDEIITCTELREDLHQGHGFKGLKYLSHRIGEGGCRQCYSGVVEDGFGNENNIVVSVVKDENPKEHRKKQLEKEVDALSRLRHDGIVSYEKVCGILGDGKYFLVMEQFGDGTNLETHIAQYGPLDKDQFESLFFDDNGIYSALKYAHKGGKRREPVFHGDLTPKNILIISNEGKIEDGVIGDWESVTHVDEEIQPHKSLGAPAYVLPIIESEEYQAKSDMASLGICMYISLTGIHPILEKSFQEVKTHNNPEIRSQVAMELSEKYVSWCQRPEEKRMAPIVEIVGEERARQIVRMIAQQEIN